MDQVLPAAPNGSPPPISGLPTYLTSFLGREADLAQLRDLLLAPDVRLVTVTGFGGIGKTRLAIELIARTPDTWRQVWFVSLAHIHEANAAGSLIARELDFEDTSSSANRVARHALSTSPCLLVLDNFEHVVDAAEQVHALLHAWPLLTILVTSRAPLNLSGEQVYALHPLTIVDDDQPGSAVQLLVDRARAHDYRTQFAAEDDQVMLDICRKLEGIPLAIELAAARVPSIGLGDLRDRLTSQLSLLTGGPRDAPARQRTLRDTIAWSYDLLDPGEQQVLQGLSVFSGGFTIDAAARVLGINQSTMVDHVLSLTACNLVHPAPSELTPAMRYRLLDPVREFAFDLLTESGRPRDVQLAHARFFTTFIEDSLPLCDGPELSAALRATATEIDNFRVAISWSLEHGIREDGVRLAGALWRHWPSRFMGEQESWTDRLSEGRRWIELALEHADGLPLDAVREALIGHTYIAVNFDPIDTTILAEIEKLWSWAADEDDTYAMYWAAFFRWQVTVDLTQPIHNYQEVLDHLIPIARRSRQPVNQEAGVYLVVGENLCATGQVAEAEPIIQRCHELSQQAGNPLYISISCQLLAELALDRGELRSALDLLKESIALRHELGSYTDFSSLNAPLARIAIQAGCPELAISLLSPDQYQPSELHDVEERSFQRALAELRSAIGDDAATAALATSAMLTDAAREAILDTLAARLLAQHPETHQLVETDLTPREADVLRLITDGQSNRSIAARLFISERTVENHVQHIFAKLKVSNRAGAAAWAVRNGLG